jgi:DNA-directed RNA polymerase specialized sigma24 family protein
MLIVLGIKRAAKYFSVKSVYFFAFIHSVIGNKVKNVLICMKFTLKMNQAEFKNFYQSCWKYCKPRLRHLTVNQADIEDIYAEAIARFWVNMQQNKITHADNHFGLVYVMAKNLYFGQIRKDKGTYMVSINNQNDGEPEIQLTNNEQDFLTKAIAEKDQYQTENKIKSAWEKLDTKCRDLLNATIVYKERQEDLLEKMNFKNTDTVKATKYRCLQYLKKYYYEMAA